MKNSLSFKLVCITLAALLPYSAAFAEPPEHSRGKGHGYGREKHHHKHKEKHHDKHAHIAFPSAPYVEVNCGSQSILGTVIGGAAGGLVGHQFGKGDGKTAATIGGAIIGAVLGNNYTQTDRNCAAQAFEYARPGTQVLWQSPDDESYAIMPGNIISRDNGEYCREYQSVVTVGGVAQPSYGTACRMPDGQWKIR